METTQDQARLEFINAIRHHAPDVLTSLAHDVLPLYRALHLRELYGGLAYWGTYWPQDYEAFGKLYISLATWQDILADTARNYQSDLGYLRDSPDAWSQFEYAFCVWARLWNLTDAWIIKLALDTLGMWEESGVTNDWAKALPVRMIKGEPFKFTFPAWNSRTDTWQAYRERLYEALADQLSEYQQEKVGVELYRADYKPSVRLPAVKYIVNEKEVDPDGNLVNLDDKVKEMRRLARGKSSSLARNFTTPRHYVWLVQFHVLKIEIKDIIGVKSLDKEEVAPSTVHEAIKQLAAFIGLTPRPAKKGRPSLNRPS